jgi:hypothetical protein
MLGMDCNGTEKRRKPSAKGLIAEGMRRRRAAAASVVGKSEKVAVPFGAYLLCKRLLPSRARGDRGEVERLSTPGPFLLHPMTGGLGPASQRRDYWRKGGKAESEPPRSQDGLE